MNEFFVPTKSTKSPIVGKKRCDRFDVVSNRPDPSLSFTLTENDWEFHFIPILIDGSFGLPKITNEHQINFLSTFFGKQDDITFSFTDVKIYHEAKRAANIYLHHDNSSCFSFLKMYFNVDVEFEVSLKNQRETLDAISAFQLCRESNITNGTGLFQELGGFKK